MAPEADVRRVAEKWVERYDMEALAQVHLRLVELREHGAAEAYELWLRIYEATKRLIDDRQRH